MLSDAQRKLARAQLGSAIAKINLDGLAEFVTTPNDL
jgi:hypothetical protein